MIARLAHYFRVSFPFSFSTLSIIFLIIPFPQNLLFDVFFFWIWILENTDLRKERGSERGVFSISRRCLTTSHLTRARDSWSGPSTLWELDLHRLGNENENKMIVFNRMALAPSFLRFLDGAPSSSLHRPQKRRCLQQLGLGRIREKEGRARGGEPVVL